MNNFKKMYKVNTANEYRHSTPLACCNNDIHGEYLNKTAILEQRLLRPDKQYHEHERFLSQQALKK
jgi:hypothetical protein